VLAARQQRKQRSLSLASKLAPTAAFALWLFLTSGCSVAGEDIKPTVLIDVGHDPVQFGTSSASGSPEFKFNLKFADVLAGRLQAGGLTVVLHIANERLSIEQRRRALASLDGALLLSVHHDSVQEVHLKRTHAYGKETTYTDEASGFSLFVSDHAAYDSSRTIAQCIGRELITSGFTPNLYHARPIPGEGRTLLDTNLGLYRFDELGVLRESKIPAILVEVAVIRNPIDEARAMDPQWQAAFADALLLGFRRCQS